MESLQHGRYELRDVLGRGGMATVYRSWDTRLQVDRAVKILADNLASRPKLRDRFESEARTMARLHHPNLVTVMDVGQEGDRFYMVMELVDGGSLQDRIKRTGALSPRQASDVMQGVLSALYLAHNKGVVHRDIKPHNVLLTAEGVPKLTDFGIAQIHSANTMTRTGAVMGTLAYMAPEQQLNAKGVDARADIYAAGATLCAIARGGEPTETLYVAEAHAKAFAGLPEPLIDVIKRACRYSPDDRFGTAEEMRSALAAAHAELPEDVDVTPLGAPIPRLEEGVWSRTLQPPPPTSEDSGPSKTWSGEGMFVERQTPRSAAGRGNTPPPPPIPAGRSRETISFGDLDELSEAAPQPQASLPESPPAGEATAFEQEQALQKRKGAWVFGGVALAALVSVGLLFGQGAPERPAEPASPPEPTPSTAPAPQPTAEPTPVEAEVPEPEPEPVVPPEPEPARAEPPPAEPKPAVKTAKKPAPKVEPPPPEPEPEPEPEPAPVQEPAPAAPEPAAAAEGRLMVNSLPWSNIQLDGASQGTTDWSARITAGRHNLVLTTSDGRVHRKTVTIPPDGVLRYCWDFNAGAICSR